MLKAGDVLRYYYLWARQADHGEESGRKDRTSASTGIGEDLGSSYV